MNLTIFFKETYLQGGASVSGPREKESEVSSCFDFHSMIYVQMRSRENLVKSRWLKKPSPFYLIREKIYEMKSIYV